MGFLKLAGFQDCFAAGLLAGGGGAFVFRNFTKAPVDESAASREVWTTTPKVNFKKLDMEERFERWIVENDKTYEDEEEKAMRFQLFKASVEMMASMQSVSPEELQEVSCFADFTEEETRNMLANPDRIVHHTEYNQVVEPCWAKQEKGVSLIWTPDVKQGDTQATQVSG